MAVEVHQDGPNSLNNVFGMVLYATSPGAGATQLHIGLSNNVVVIGWSGAGTLQTAATLNTPGAWSDVTTNSPYATAPMSTNRFFRLRLSP